MVRGYILYIIKIRTLYKDYRRMRKLVKHTTGNDSKLQQKIRNYMIQEKLLSCDLRVKELNHGIKKSYFHYAKRYDNLYTQLLQIIGEVE